MGKTAFVLSMARNMALDFGHPVALFSLEMSSVQLITRLISSETGLSSEKLRTGKLEKHEWEQLSVKVKDLEKAPLYIDDTPSLSIFDLRAKARRLSSQYGIKLIIVDYLQLMTAEENSKGGGNREQEISTISRNLKALAKELEVPVIALSQLSRAVETRGSSKRPLLSDFVNRVPLSKMPILFRLFIVQNIIKLMNGMMMNNRQHKVKPNLSLQNTETVP
jgi:replicative DNA helicase